MIRLSNIQLNRGSRALLEGVDWTLHHGQKVGVVGKNGAGKSSLFALIRGDLSPEAGTLELPPRLRMGHVAQETPALDCSALDYVLQGDERLTHWQAELTRAEQAHDGHRMAECHGELEQLNAYRAPSVAQELLHGLGFAPGEDQRPVKSFSGGWRMRLNLARALMSTADVLLLDEPTNHLDLEAVLWLQDWLRNYPGTLLIISHNRHFLDHIVTHIAEIRQQRLNLYSGNYSLYETQRAARLAEQAAEHAKQQRQRQHWQSFVDRFRAQATKARQAQSRLKALERLPLLALAEEEDSCAFQFQPAQAAGDPLLALDQVGLVLQGKTILAPCKIRLLCGQRIGLLGVNGAGKSSLIKLMAGSLAPTQGQLVPHPKLVVGYYAQHQLETLRPEDSPLQHLRRLAPLEPEQKLRDYLGGFHFRGDQTTQAIAPLSGGEKARLAMALVLWCRPNLLLLDEPTNHLDLDLCRSLMLALQQFDGTLVLVSHDQDLLETVCDEYWLVHQGQVQVFAGDLEDYRQFRLQERQQAKAKSSGSTGDVDTGLNRRELRRQEAETRQKLDALRKPIQKRIQAAEKRMAELQSLLENLSAALLDEALYEASAKKDLLERLRQQAQAQTELAQLEETWLEEQTQLEEINAQEH